MSAKKQLEESTLLALLSEDSDYAFQLLFQCYHNHVYKVAMIYVKSPALAEDIVQDIFMKIWFQRKNLPALNSFESWLYTLTKNSTLSSLKKQAYERKARTTFSQQSDQFENATDHKIRDLQFRELLMQAVEQLPEQQKKVYYLAKERGLSYAAIADELSLSPLTVKTHMSRALTSIRSFLQKHDKEFLLLFIIRFL